MYSHAPTSEMRGPLGRGLDAIDARGPGAWVALTILGFVFGGPLGLVVLGFALGTGRFARRNYPHLAKAGGGCAGGWGVMRRTHAARATGNSAFDQYKADTLERLEREQRDFEAFLGRLRESRDKAEFDQYMAERARAAAEETPQDGETPERGGY